LSQSREGTVTALRQSRCHISGLIIVRDRFNAPRARVVKEAVAARADSGGAPLPPCAPDRNREGARDGHVTCHLSTVMLRASGPCTLAWMAGVHDTAAAEVFPGCVPVRGAYGQPELARQQGPDVPPPARRRDIRGRSRGSWVVSRPVAGQELAGGVVTHMQAPARRVAHVRGRGRSCQPTYC
jgi:hypothetical protein